MSKQQDDQSQALAMMKAVFDDQSMEINGREYKFTKLTHKKRRKVFAFYSKCQAEITAKDFSFLDSSDFEPVEKIMHESIMLDDSLVSKIPNHWEDHPEDYVMFTLTALAVISYPFLGASLTA